MGKNTQAEKPKAKRKMLTPAERIAKLEAEARAIREKEIEKAKASRTKVAEALEAAKTRVTEAQAKVDKLTAELEAIDQLTTDEAAEPASEEPAA